MGSKRPYSYRWRLFWIIFILMLTTFIVIAVFQYKREQDMRVEQVSKQLHLVKERIIKAYEQDISLLPFTNFLSGYESEISGGVYDMSTGRLMYNIGVNNRLQDYPDSQPGATYDLPDGALEREERVMSGKQPYLTLTGISPDGKVYVRISQKYDMDWTAPFTAEKDMWFTLLGVFVATTVALVYSTRYLGKNVTLLRDFANLAASGVEVIDENKFPHDELGDISRQIVKLYQAKDEAVKRSKREHEIAIHAVEEKARIKRQLTNNINHELKTPIGVIKGFVDTIISDPSMSPETRNRFLQRTQENVDRLCNLLSDVSAMTRLEEGGKNVPVAEINFHDLVFGIENDLMESGLAGDMAFIYNLPLDCVVEGNASLLTGMVSNLIKNAAQYSHGTEMGINLIVENAKFYTFSFYDNGSGVEPHHLPHLFERFYRIDAGRSRKAGGTGLGLPIVKNTVEALGGTISAHNRSEGGLEFVFTLKKWRG